LVCAVCSDRLVHHGGDRVDGEQDLADGLVGVAGDQADPVPGLRGGRRVALLDQADHVREGGGHGSSIDLIARRSSIAA
jgi:hypothetical protein